jgi:L-lactate utilization protein LutC
MSKRKIEGFYCDTKEEAAEKVLSFIEEEKTVTWGGTTTLSQLGIKEMLADGNYNVLDRDKFTGVDRVNAMKEGFFADYYLTSSNAVTQDGMLVNIDGSGNRVAAMCFGPSNVIVIVGINKIVHNVECAVERIRNIASPPNALRLNIKTPCSATGVCSDCLSDDCICSDILITRFNRFPGRIKVIIVGENLGF